MRGNKMKKTKLIMISFMLTLILAACDDTWKTQENISGEENVKNDGERLETIDNTPTGVPIVTITPTLTPTIQPLSQEEILSLSLPEVADYVRKSALSDECIALEVKVYDDEFWEERLVGKGRPYHIGVDFGAFERSGRGTSLVQTFLYMYPETKARKMPNGMYYMAYASESGGRVYYFASEENDLRALIGLPVLICGKLKKHSDFESITIGCTLDDVLAIDSTVEDYYDLFYHWMQPNKDSMWAATNVLRHTTVHYLEDGILVYGYGALNDSGKLVITEIKYSPEYTLQDCRGRDIVYKINPLDLPSVE